MQSSACKSWEHWQRPEKKIGGAGSGSGTKQPYLVYAKQEENYADDNKKANSFMVPLALVSTTQCRQLCSKK